MQYNNNLFENITTLKQNNDFELFNIDMMFWPTSDD